MNIPSTNELLKRLEHTNSLSDLDKYDKETSSYQIPQTFSEYLEHCLFVSSLTPAELFEHAQIQRNYGYQILNGQKNPGRNKVLSLCLALSLKLEEVQRALTLAKEGSLYPKNRRDSVLIFCINKQMSVSDTNLLLHNKNLELL